MCADPSRVAGRKEESGLALGDDGRPGDPVARAKRVPIEYRAVHPSGSQADTVPIGATLDGADALAPFARAALPASGAAGSVPSPAPERPRGSSLAASPASVSVSAPVPVLASRPASGSAARSHPDCAAAGSSGLPVRNQSVPSTGWSCRA